MATTDKSYTLSSTSKGPYDFAFPYLNTKDVQVTLNGTRLIPIEEDSVNYKFTRQTTQITLVDTPSVGDKLRIYRATDDTNLSSTFYPGSAIKSGDLNDNFTQNLYTTQENTNDAGTALTSVRVWDPTLDNGTGDWKTAFAKADDAETTANAADGKADTAITTSTNAANDATAAVASAAQANTTAGNAVTSAANANTTAGNAVTSATNANTTAANAVASAATANTTAGNAVSTANDAETKADTAIATANTASTTAGNAVTSAATANTTAGNAVTTANAVEATVELYVADSTGLRGGGTTHGQTPNTDPQGVAYAVRIAEEASASVAASAIYKVVDDLATLATDYPLTGNQPSPPGPDPNNLAPTPDGTYVQITDSTGISLSNSTWTTTNNVAFSSTSGFPSGFDGHSQLTLRVKVSNSTAGSESYVAQEYYANDPESRYGEDRKVVVENDQVIDANYTIQLDKNAHSVSGGLVFNNSTNKYDGPVTITHNGTDLTYNPENHAQPFVATNAATAGNTVTIPVNSTWLIS